MERPSTPEIFETMIIHFAEGDYRKFSDYGIQSRISKVLTFFSLVWSFARYNRYFRHHLQFLNRHLRHYHYTRLALGKISHLTAALNNYQLSCFALAL